MRKYLILTFLVLSFSSLAYATSYTSKVILGVIEDNRMELVNWKPGPAKKRVVIPMFEKKGEEWAVILTQNDKLRWTIAFDGKSLGTFNSVPAMSSGQRTIPDIAHFPEPGSNQKLAFGKPNKRFSGWQYTNMHRPFIVVANGNFKDPEQWKTFKHTQKQADYFKSLFRKEYPTVTNCDENEKALPNPWKYENSSIELGKKAYQSNKNFLIIGMKLTGCKCGLFHGPFIEQKFIISPDGSYEHLLLNSNDSFSLTLVDAGDYDSDGKSEVVFFVSGYNEDGYALFYNFFRNHVNYTWHYH